MKNPQSIQSLSVEPPAVPEWIAEKHYYRISRMTEHQRSYLAPDVMEGYLKWLTATEGRCIF